MLEPTGLAFTTRHALHPPIPPSGLVTVTSRPPTSAVLPTVTVMVSCVEDPKVVPTMVIPPPDSFTLLPDWKPVPVNVIARAVAPWPTAGAEVTVGPARTVRQAVHPPIPKSGLVMV